MARFGRSKKSGKAERRPDGQVRQSQLLSAYGAGSLIDLVQHAVIVQGLDDWSFRGEPYRDDIAIEEPRLKDKLEKKYNLRLADEAYFRRPPPGDDDDPNPAMGIRVLEFPAFFVCQGCRQLVHRSVLGAAVTSDGRRYHRDCERKEKPPVVPVRFVTACRRGHLDDFPWRDFAHYGREKCKHGVLTLHEGVAGDFNDIRVRCSCDPKQSMRLADARADHVTLKCWGKRPWLPPDHDEICEEEAHLLVRTASNGYFSLQLSALSVPDPDNEIRDALSRDTERIRKRLEKSEDRLRAFLEDDHEALVERHSMDAVVVQARLLAAGQAVERAGLRSAEYLQLTKFAELERPDERFDEDAQFIARRLDKTFPKVGTVTLVHRLREVLVQFGFTRLEPSSADLQGEIDLGVARAPLASDESWLPAATLQGEGVFFTLDFDALEEWFRREAVQKRADHLAAGWKRWHEERQGYGAKKKIPPFLGVRFYLLHSLSHLLINSIAMQCGYSASAIKERIYAGPLDGGGEMAGILLYTGTVGSEGTLGGLVERGRHLDLHLRRALEGAQLCSNDPICAAHEPKDDPSDRLLEGASCHGCVLIAETSCDRRFNRNLDRALVVPVIGQDPELAFFSREDFER